MSANAAANSDPTFATEARALFSALEQGDPAQTAQWSLIRECTKKELELTYDRLGVRFDHFHGEAMYGIKDSEDVIRKVKEAKICSAEEGGRLVATVTTDDGKERKVKRKRIKR